MAFIQRYHLVSGYFHLYSRIIPRMVSSNILSHLAIGIMVFSAARMYPSYFARRIQFSKVTRGYYGGELLGIDFLFELVIDA